MNPGKQRKGSAVSQGRCYMVSASKTALPLFEVQTLWTALWKVMMQLWSLSSFYPWCPEIKQSAKIPGASAWAKDLNLQTSKQEHGPILLNFDL